jgi:hypothetical protein
MSDQTVELTDAEGTTSKRMPLLLGILALTLVALGAGYFFLFAGTASEPLATTDPLDGPTGALGTADEADVDAAEGDIVALPVVTYDVYLARDPFDPVVPEPEPEASATPATGDGDGTEPVFTGGDGSVDGADGQPTDPSNPPDGSGEGEPGDGAPEGGCRGEEEVVCDGQVLTLVDVATKDGQPVAIIKVDTSIYEVPEGGVFATFYQVRAIDGSCASVLYGDDGFTLCRGDRVLK